MGMTADKTQIADIPPEDWDAILGALHDDILIADGKGIVLKVSPSFKKIYGVSNGDVVGESVFDLERRGIFKPSVTAQVIASGETTTLMQKNARGRDIVVTATPVKDARGEIYRVVSFSRDVTEYLQLKEQYANLEEQVALYEAELRELRSNASYIDGVVAKSELMQKVLRTINKVAGYDANILFLGESGVGKTMLARLVHGKSKRRDGAFIDINCGAIPENLLESEFFGYEKGAFTGANFSGKVGLMELASRGTLFLDEIGELPLVMQVKLLKAIQDRNIMRVGGVKSRQVDFRLITATNRDLDHLVQEGNFREDLFFRLNVVAIYIPPLRERSEDILPLAWDILEKCCQKYGMKKKLSPRVVRWLLAYSWPGNVRELENVLERMALTSEGSNIDEDAIPDNLNKKKERNHARGQSQLLVEALTELEGEMVLSAYAQYKTTVASAQALGISQPSAARKIAKYKQAQNGKK
jgi:PAS domain S-box-containing protein